MKQRNFIKVTATLTFLFASLTAMAHHGEIHGGPLPPEEKLKRINERYVQDVKPIFEKKCADCHSDHTVYPWYHKIPGIKQLIDHDIADGREHLDFSNDFPFKGHGNVQDDFKAIREDVSEGEMPPWTYWIVHSGTKLTDEEKKTIMHWLDDGEQVLNAPTSK